MSDRALTELLYGKGAHANPLACIEDVSLELTGRRMEGFPHSIWQIVGHMNFWMDYELQRIHGEAHKYPEHAALSWPASSAPDGDQEWKRSVALFRELLGRLAAMAQDSEEKLARQVEGTHASHGSLASTVRDVLWQTVAHNSYHVGQIAMLRRSLGFWPPRDGGDSW